MRNDLNFGRVFRGKRLPLAQKGWEQLLPTALLWVVYRGR